MNAGNMLLRDWKVLLGFAVAIIFLPQVLQSYNTATQIWIFGLLAIAFNMLLGYTGLLSLGQATFFGLGAYSAGLLQAHLEWNIFPVMAIAAIVGGLGALIIGIVCVQRVGIYFILLTFSFNLMFYFIVYEWTEVTGSVDGLYGATRPTLSVPYLFELDMSSYEGYYAFTVAVVLLCYFVIGRIVRSPFGKTLTMIRENELRAAALGYNVKLYKLMAFVIAGMFSGLAGMLVAGLFEYVSIEWAFWTTSAEIVFMALIGGIANMIGPLIGAAVFIWLSDTLSELWPRWNLLLGLIFMAVVLFFQGGIVQLSTQARDLLLRLKAKIFPSAQSGGERGAS